MNRLPPEILTSIFILLYQRDKVECMTVCRKWANIIEDFCLFNTVFLYNKEAFEYMVKKFQDRPEKGAQVENLIIDMYHYGPIELNDLTLLLPNLRLFYVDTVDNGFLITPVENQSWNDYIERLMVYNNPILFKKLFTVNKFSQLKYLTANGDRISDPTFLNVLPGLTNLTDLLVQDAEISFSLLESIHKGAPQLKSLNFDYSVFKDERLSLGIQPVISLSKLHLTTDLYISIETQVAWLQYISKKYPKLSDLKLYREVDSEILEDDDSERKRILLSEHFKLFFQKCGARLKKLYIRWYRFPQNLFEILDDTLCELQEIALYTPTPSYIIKYIAHSNQSQNIKALKLGSFLNSDINWIKEMAALKKLSITFDESNDFVVPKFNHVLDMCPNTLEKLKLSQFNMEIDDSPISRFISIKSLSFKSVQIPTKFNDFLVAHLPQLINLRIIHCKLDEPRIALPNHHLLHFEFANFLCGKHTEVLVITSKAKVNGKMIYSSSCLSGRPAGFYNNKTIIPYNTQTKREVYNFSRDRPTMTLECATIVEVIVLS